MKCHTDYLYFNTKKRHEFVNITDKVQEVIDSSGVQDGMALVSAMHITAGVYVNDAESGLIHDIESWLKEIAPTNKNYRHHMTGEDNGYAHLWNLIVGHQVTVPITKGTLDFGPWQQIYYAEFDGIRKKRVIVKVMGL
ncbi:MAG: YjbQ family protein [Deltaproteobacteria bacterium]|jgi:secondary thiamine-phosphate synthase enzyme|nr:YjbQ family protein [Deltaproteobacteria bacterium]